MLFVSQMQLMRRDPPLFFRYYRMSPKKFDELHRIVRKDLTKAYLIREPISSQQRLAITLRYRSIDRPSSYMFFSCGC